MGEAEETGVRPIWPGGTSAEYIAARLDVAKMERALRDQVEGPRSPSTDTPTRITRLSELFGGLPANFIDGAQRGIDLLSPVWNVLDLHPRGRADWYASNSYAGESSPNQHNGGGLLSTQPRMPNS